MSKIIIITPASRFKNLKILKKSINFNFIFKWIIIYDGNLIKNYFKQFEKINQIEEFIYFPSINEIQGNGQRNYALDHIKKNYSTECPFIYFLDDDNIIHPNFYKLISKFQENHMYTFDQQRTRYILSGIKPKLYYIDQAMFISDFNIVRDIRFNSSTYNADGSYIEECYKKNTKNHLYINEIGSYYNYLRRNIIRRSYYIIYWFLKSLIFKINRKKIQKRLQP
jgi:hypothetical protein